ncbi:MAG: hypothetical protein Ct9H90mP24_1930 [Methanobacteriota archaeon]|nr:MAG: hypothetical protein Ct9H90mP24_1930 [Euryarchaeota archaeon]
MALQWSPSEVNIATSATTGATNASIGFIFTFPAIFLLAYSDDYRVGDGHLLSSVDTLNLAFVGIIASMFAGFLGVMYFIIFRRVWLVEDPLPMPGFEATLKMLDISSGLARLGRCRTRLPTNRRGLDGPDKGDHVRYRLPGPLVKEARRGAKQHR